MANKSMQRVLHFVQDALFDGNSLEIFTVTLCICHTFCNSNDVERIAQQEFIDSVNPESFKLSVYIEYILYILNIRYILNI